MSDIVFKEINREIENQIVEIWGECVKETDGKPIYGFYVVKTL